MPEEVALIAVGVGATATGGLDARPTFVAEQAVVVPIVDVGVEETRLVHVPVAYGEALLCAFGELFPSLSTHPEVFVFEFALFERVHYARRKCRYVHAGVRLAR